MGIISGFPVVLKQNPPGVLTQRVNIKGESYLIAGFLQLPIGSVISGYGNPQVGITDIILIS